MSEEVLDPVKKPILVYYLHYYDELRTEKAWNQFQNHVTCIMASNNQEAIEKTKLIVGNTNIKIMGIANGKEEWVNELAPLG